MDKVKPETLNQAISEIMDACRNHTMNELVSDDLAITTAYRFRYLLEKNSLCVTSTTLRKIAIRLDELENTHGYYLNHIQSAIEAFVTQYIFILPKPDLNERGLTYAVMNRICDFSLKQSYRLTTLTNYANKLADVREEMNTKGGHKIDAIN